MPLKTGQGIGQAFALAHRAADFLHELLEGGVKGHVGEYGLAESGHGVARGEHGAAAGECLPMAAVVVPEFDVIVRIGLAHGEIPTVGFRRHGHLGLRAIRALPTVAQENGALNAFGQRVIPITKKPMRFLRDHENAFFAVAARKVTEMVNVRSGRFLCASPYGWFSGGGLADVFGDLRGLPARGGHLAFGRCFFGFRFRAFDRGFDRFFHGDTCARARQSAGESPGKVPQ